LAEELRSSDTLGDAGLESRTRAARRSTVVRDLRPLLWMPRAGDIPGGHVMQLRETAGALRRLGLSVSESFEERPDLSRATLVHGFGLNVADVRSCRRRALPVALSTIYGDLSWRRGRGGGPLTFREVAGRARRGVRFARASMQGAPFIARSSLGEVADECRMIAAYSAVDVLLPNARGEATSIIAELGVRTPTRLVPNAADPDRFPQADTPFSARDVVLCCGRIEPHKNQLALISALANTGLRLVIAGPPHPHHPTYYERCVSHAGERVLFTGYLQPGERLAALYRSARVHVLPTWFETTGLASLEAGLSGCNVVTTSRGHAREYFGDFAWYCDPARPRSIREAVLAAWDAPPTPALRQRIVDNYTWEHTAKATLDAYLNILDVRATAEAR
jgi:glycosyltransferase involved in cell wall biosynthesis